MLYWRPENPKPRLSQAGGSRLPLDTAVSASPMKIRSLLILTLSLCGFLRLYHLDGYGLWSDEFVTLLIVSAKSFRELIQTCFEVPQPMPPLYFLANKWIYGFFAPGEIGLRVLSAQGYNFFPATPHIECLVVLERQDS